MILPIILVPKSMIYQKYYLYSIIFTIFVKATKTEDISIIFMSITDSFSEMTLIFIKNL